MAELFIRIYDLFARRRGLLWALLGLLVGAMAWGASRVGYDEQITGLFREEEGTGGGRRGRREAMIFERLAMMDRVMVMFTSPDPDRSIEAAEAFEALLADDAGASLIASIEGGSGSAGTVTEEAIGFVYGNLPFYLTDRDYARLEEQLASDGVEQAVAVVRQRLASPLGGAVGDVLLQDPLGMATGRLAALEGFSRLANYEIYDDRLFSPGLETLLIVIEPRHGIGDTGAGEVLISAIERCAAHVANTLPDVTIDYFGGPSVAVHNARRVKTDTRLTLSIALAVTVLFILAAFRNRRAVWLILTPVAFGGLFALAAMWLAGQHTMSAIALGAGAVVAGIALSYSIHVISHANHTSDPRRIIRELAMPLTVGSFTTIGAFAGLLFTGSRLLRDLGAFASLTLIGTTIFCLVFLPHMLGRGRVGGSGSAGGVGRFIERIADYPYDRNKWLVWSVLAVAAVCLFFYGRVGFNSDMMSLNYFSPTMQAGQERLSSFSRQGRQPVMMVSTGADFESAHASLSLAESVLDSLRSEGLVQGWVSVSEFLPPVSVQRERLEQWNRFWNAPEAGGTRRQALAERIDRGSIEAGFRPGAFTGFASNLTREYSVRDLAADGGGVPDFLADWTGVADDGTVMLIAGVTLEPENKAAVYARLAAETQPASQPSGRQEVMIVDRAWFAGRMARGVADDFNLTLTIASVLIFIALLISYGRIELTLMAFMPMALSWVIILGLMALAGVEFNIVSIILSTFIFGIGDDFSIFMMDGLLAGYRSGARMLRAHKTAIFFSAFTIVVGLGVMILARHPAMHSLAVVSIVGIVTVIVVAWVVQPIVFRAVVSAPTRHGGFPWTLKSLAASIAVFAWFLAGCVVLQVVMLVLGVVPGAKKRKRLWFHAAMCGVIRFFLRTTIAKRMVTINGDGETFRKPAVIVANHSSFVDILVLLSLHPRIVMVTNSWVWRSPFFGRIVRMAGFQHTAEGYDRLAEGLRERVREGFSVVVFPEGTRASREGCIGRFHKGAFWLAGRLGLDIVPVVLYGNGLVVSRQQPFYIKRGVMVSKILPRISPESPADYREVTKAVERLFQAEYEKVHEEWSRADRNPWFRQALVTNFIYKGPVLEWYMRVKGRMEDCWDWFDRTVPRRARIVDIGCGYGPLTFMLAMLSRERKVVGIDFDEQKIAVARHSFLYNFLRGEGEHRENSGDGGRVEFLYADVSVPATELPRADVFILSDVLHYLPYGAQEALLARCFTLLEPGGMVIVRDGDSSDDDRQKHRATERTERWSTRLVGFNKTAGELHFTDSARITAAAERAGFSVRVVERSRKLSNKIYVCTSMS